MSPAQPTETIGDDGINNDSSNSLDVVREEWLFVDDREHNCEGARAVGMLAVRFEDTAQLRTELRAYMVFSLPDGRAWH